MRVGQLGVCFVGVFALLACGEANTNSPGGAGTSSAGSNVGGGASAGGPSAGSSSQAGESSGGNSAGGQPGANGGSTGKAGGASGGAPGVPASLPPIQCAAGELVYEGTVGGVAVKERFTPSGPSAGPAILGAYSGGASVAFVAPGPQPQKLSGGVLQFPTGSAHAGKIWCIDSGSLLGDGAKPAGALIGHLLGTCPGTSVAGTLYTCSDAHQGYCDNKGEPSKRALGGQLAGKELDSPSIGLTTVSAQAWASSTQLFDVLLFAGSVPSTASAAKVSGLLVATQENPDAGAVYCVGDGQWKQYSDDSVLNADVATLSQLSYVGSCKDSGPTESLNVCIGL